MTLADALALSTLSFAAVILAAILLVQAARSAKVIPFLSYVLVSVALAVAVVVANRP